jgi:hypothetical protein
MSNGLRTVTDDQKPNHADGEVDPLGDYGQADSACARVNCHSTLLFTHH